MLFLYLDELLYESETFNRFACIIAISIFVTIIYQRTKYKNLLIYFLRII